VSIPHIEVNVVLADNLEYLQYRDPRVLVLQVRVYLFFVPEHIYLVEETHGLLHGLVQHLTLCG